MQGAVQLHGLEDEKREEKLFLFPLACLSSFCETLQVCVLLEGLPCIPWLVVGAFEAWRLDRFRFRFLIDSRPIEEPHSMAFLRDVSAPMGTAVGPPCTACAEAW